MSVSRDTLHFCTSMGSGGIPKFLAQYWSLTRHCKQSFEFWVYTDSQQALGALKALQLPFVKIRSFAEIEEFDGELENARSERDVFMYNDTIRPSMMLGILKANPQARSITYMDTDLYFFADPGLLYRQLYDQSVLLSRHRFAQECLQKGLCPELFGDYNSGWVSARADERGVACLQQWRQWCLAACPAEPSNGLYGNQKYLEDLATLPGVADLDLIGANVAPWNVPDIEVFQDGIGRLWVDSELLIFYHFHALQLPGETSYKVSASIGASAGQLTNRDYSLREEIVKAIYLPYIKDLTKAIAICGQLDVFP